MRWIKRRFGFQQDFERQIVGYAKENACEGIICGHVHTPTVGQRDEILIYNTGDWIENCTALLEYADGSMELYYHFPAMRAVTSVAGGELRPAILGINSQE